MDKTSESRLGRSLLAGVLVCLAVVMAIWGLTQRSGRGLKTQNGEILFYNEDGSLYTGGYQEVTHLGKTDYYFFQEDGTAFTGGYKAIEREGKRFYYFFQEDGKAFTDGYRNFTVDGKEYHFYFNPDGTAFTDGYKEVTIGGKSYIFYFLANGQAYTGGYKTVMMGGEKYYYYFGEDGRALTDTVQTLPMGDRTVYMLFGKDGKAFTEGYKEMPGENGTDYYYFLPNGQAFTTGYKTVTAGGITDYYYFESDGKAFTGGLKEIPFGEETHCYYFQENGKAKTSGEDGTYRFGADGRALRNAFVTLDGGRYYYGDDGALVKGGWFCVDDGYYYAGHDGKLLTDQVKEGYVLDETGKCSTKYRVIQLLEELVDESMTDQEKIDAIYNWMLRNDMGYIRTYEHVKQDWVWKESWVDDMAASMLDNWGGNCYGYASLSGLLFREATGLPVAVYHGWTPGPSYSLIPHGWAAIFQDGEWYVYDPELFKFGSYFVHNCYQEPAEGSFIHVNGVPTYLY